MKKLYGGSSGGGGGRRGKVHPSPSPTNPDHYLSILAALPAAMLALTAALATEDREVLAYLISCGGERPTHLEECENKAAIRRRRSVGGAAEGPPPVFGCSCFHCYTSYWARWDASPSRQLIHEIIDALEEANLQRAAGRKKAKTATRGRAGAGRRGGGVAEGTDAEGSETGLDGRHVGEGLLDGEQDGAEAEEEEQGEQGEQRRSSVKRLVNFLGERIWGVWSF